jgi:hypothetical protein
MKLALSKSLIGAISRIKMVPLNKISISQGALDFFGPKMVLAFASAI